MARQQVRVKPVMAACIGCVALICRYVVLKVQNRYFTKSAIFLTVKSTAAASAGICAPLWSLPAQVCFCRSQTPKYANAMFSCTGIFHEQCQCFLFSAAHFPAKTMQQEIALSPASPPPQNSLRWEERKFLE